MTDETKKLFDREELRRGFLRYEAVRKLTPIEFHKLYVAALKGENFDHLVDQLVVSKQQNTHE